MRSRRVPFLRLGSRGPGGHARSLRLCSQASASVRKRSQSSASVRGASDLPERRKSSRNAKLSSLLTFRSTKVSTVTGIGGVVVAKGRTVVTIGVASRERKGERREERGEKRDERREKRGERREEESG